MTKKTKTCKKAPINSSKITKEDIELLHKEAKIWYKEFKKKIKAMESITAEDWRTKVK